MTKITDMPLINAGNHDKITDYLNFLNDNEFKQPRVGFASNGIENLLPPAMRSSETLFQLKKKDKDKI